MRAFGFLREETNEKAVTHLWSVRFDQWNRVLSETDRERDGLKGPVKLVRVRQG